MIFETERMIARPWTLDDAEAAFDMYGDPEVMRYLGRNGAGATIGSVEEMRDRLGKAIDKYGDSPNGYIYAALVLKSIQQPIGTALLKPLELTSGEWADEIEIGWHLARAYWGKGLGTECALGVMRYGFDTLELPELHAIAYPENKASLRIMQKIGMDYRGSTDKFYGVTAEHYVKQRFAPPEL